MGNGEWGGELAATRRYSGAERVTRDPRDRYPIPRDARAPLRSTVASRLTVFALLLFASVGIADDGSKFALKSEKLDPPQALKEPIRSLLGDEAVQVFDGDGKHLATLWLRKEIPTKAIKEQVKNGLTYREIPPSTVVGAIELVQNWKDFRHHEIEKGVYTLRIAVQPTSDDHVGTAPFQDFCLLCPADKDEKPDLLEPKALVELSAESHGGTHPVAMLLFPYSKPEEKPKWVAQGKGIWTANLKQVVTGEGEKTTLGFAFVVVGKSGE
jgi:hypothetical protein